MLTLPDTLQASYINGKCRLEPFELELACTETLAASISMYYSMADQTYQSSYRPTQKIPCKYMSYPKPKLVCEGVKLECEKPVRKIRLTLRDVLRQLWTGTVDLEWFTEAIEVPEAEVPEVEVAEADPEPIIPILPSVDVPSNVDDKTGKDSNKRPRSPSSMCSTDGCNRMAMVDDECLVCYYSERVEAIRKRNASLLEKVAQYKTEAVQVACKDIETHLAAKETELDEVERKATESTRLELLEQAKTVKDSVCPHIVPAGTSVGSD